MLTPCLSISKVNIPSLGLPRSSAHTPLHSWWQSPARRSGPRVKFPDWLDLGRQALPPDKSLRSALPGCTVSPPPPCAPPLRVQGVPASSRKVVGLLQSALQTLPRLDLPATQGGGSTSTHFTDGRTKPEPGSHPSSADFKTFCPLRIVNPNGFQMRGAHQLGVPGTGSPRR